MKKSLEFSLVPHINKAVNQAKLDLWEAFIGKFTELEKSIDVRFEEYVHLINYGPQEDAPRQTHKKNFMNQQTLSHEQSAISNKLDQKTAATKPGIQLNSSKSAVSKGRVSLIQEELRRPASRRRRLERLPPRKEPPPLLRQTRKRNKMRRYPRKERKW